MQKKTGSLPERLTQGQWIDGVFVQSEEDGGVNIWMDMKEDRWRLIRIRPRANTVRLNHYAVYGTCENMRGDLQAVLCSETHWKQHQRSRLDWMKTFFSRKELELTTLPNGQQAELVREGQKHTRRDMILVLASQEHASPATEIPLLLPELASLEMLGGGTLVEDLYQAGRLHVIETYENMHSPLCIDMDSAVAAHGYEPESGAPKLFTTLQQLDLAYPAQWDQQWRNLCLLAGYRPSFSYTIQCHSLLPKKDGEPGKVGEEEEEESEEDTATIDTLTRNRTATAWIDFSSLKDARSAYSDTLRAHIRAYLDGLPNNSMILHGATGLVMSHYARVYERPRGVCIGSPYRILIGTEDFGANPGDGRSSVRFGRGYAYLSAAMFSHHLWTDLLGKRMANLHHFMRLSHAEKVPSTIAWVQKLDEAIPGFAQQWHEHPVVRGPHAGMQFLWIPEVSGQWGMFSGCTLQEKEGTVQSEDLPFRIRICTSDGGMYSAGAQGHLTVNAGLVARWCTNPYILYTFMDPFHLQVQIPTHSDAWIDIGSFCLDEDDILELLAAGILQEKDLRTLEDAGLLFFGEEDEKTEGKT